MNALRMGTRPLHIHTRGTDVRILFEPTSIMKCGDELINIAYSRDTAMIPEELASLHSRRSSDQRDEPTMPNMERTEHDSTFFAIMSEITVDAVSSTL